MIGWIMVFLLIAILAGIFIFGSVLATWIAQLLFVIFLTMLVIDLLASGFRGSSPRRMS